MKEYQFHPLSELFPLLPASEIKVLAADIKSNGLRQSIVLLDGKILDGRHRYEACAIAKVAPRFSPFSGKDPMAYVLSCNLHRRHLDTGQRAMVAARLTDMRQGERTDLEPSANLRKVSQPEAAEPSANLRKVSQPEAAELLDVSTRSVSTAKKIIDASPALAKQVDAKKISLNAASQKLADKESKSDPVLDEIGWEIPSDLHEFWGRRGVMMTMMRELASIKNLLIEAQETSDLMFRGLNYSDAVMKLQFLHGEISGLRPYAVCVTCQGRATRTKCTHCKGKGFLAQYAYRLVPPEVRAIREKGCKK